MWFDILHLSMTLSPSETFLAGLCGSFAVEVVTAVNVYQKEPVVFPERYRRWLFWVVRFLLAIIGGGLAVAYDITTPILAANVGASAPLIMNALSQGFRAGPD